MPAATGLFLTTASSFLIMPPLTIPRRIRLSPRRSLCPSLRRSPRKTPAPVCLRQHRHKPAALFYGWPRYAAVLLWPPCCMQKNTLGAANNRLWHTSRRMKVYPILLWPRYLFLNGLPYDKSSSKNRLNKAAVQPGLKKSRLRPYQTKKRCFTACRLLPCRFLIPSAQKAFAGR